MVGPQYYLTGRPRQDYTSNRPVYFRIGKAKVPDLDVRHEILFPILGSIWRS